MEGRRQLSLAQLEQLRKEGFNVESSESIAAKRAVRARKKVEQEEKDRAEKEFQDAFIAIKKFLPDFQQTKVFLKMLQEEIRTQRKLGLERKKEKFTLPSSLREPYFLAFKVLDFSNYRVELGALAIEGLKIQDRDVKMFTYEFLDNILANGFVDMGWVTCMLNKKYVSRYGWALLRKHSEKLSKPGGYILGDILDEWADDSDTWKKWEKLAKQDGKPVDTRKLYPRA
jgi:hypothetical protein